MRLTKLAHAAMILEHGGTSIVIDPGKFSELPSGPGGVAAVVVTHQHDDHWTPANLEEIVDSNPGIPIFAAPDAAAKISAAGIDNGARIVPVRAGDSHEVGGFALRFYGGIHAEIHSSMPRVNNVGVLVNGTFYYGGDAYDFPADAEIETLAVAANAPWMRLADSMDYITAVAAKRVVPVHEMLLSEAGKTLAYTRLRVVAEATGGEFLLLQPGESADIAG